MKKLIVLAMLSCGLFAGNLVDDVVKLDLQMAKAKVEKMNLIKDATKDLSKEEKKEFMKKFHNDLKAKIETLSDEEKALLKPKKPCNCNKMDKNGNKKPCNCEKMKKPCDCDKHKSHKHHEH